MFVVGELLRDLPPEDRITPIVGMLPPASRHHPADSLQKSHSQSLL
jgi:23S rRNA C2498 (ribose-2'-O)-methylase RlmM